MSLIQKREPAGDKYRELIGQPASGNAIVKKRANGREGIHKFEKSLRAARVSTLAAFQYLGHKVTQKTILNGNSIPCAADAVMKTSPRFLYLLFLAKKTPRI